MCNTPNDKLVHGLSNAKQTYKIIGPEKQGRRYIYKMGEEKLPQEMTVREVMGLITRAKMEGRVYPPTAIRRYTHKAYERLETRIVPEVNGLGCFLKRDRKNIQAGELIGVYEGVMGGAEGPYALQLPGEIVDGDPSHPINAMMSRINDDFVRPERRNCRFNPGGLVVATKRITAGEQLLLDYGTDYDWDHVKVHAVRALGKRIQVAAEKLEVEGFDLPMHEMCEVLANLPQEWRKITSGQPWGTLVEGLVDEKLGEDVMHRYLPNRRKGDTFAVWVERLLTCKPFATRSGYTKWTAWNMDEWEWLSNRAPARYGRLPRRSQLAAADLSEADTERILPSEADPGGRRTLWNDVEEDIQTDGEEDTQGSAPMPRPKARVCQTNTPMRPRGKDSLLRILEYNVNTLTEEREKEVVDMVIERKVDCTILLDTRKSKIQLRYICNRLKDALGPEYYVATAPVDAETVAGQRVGGQLWIVDMRTVSKPKFKVVTERGALAYVDGTVGNNEKIRIIGTYWPSRNPAGGSMWMQLGADQAIPTLKRCIGELIDEANEGGRTTVLAGDFNSDINTNDVYGVEEARQRWGLAHIANTEDKSWRNKRAQTRIDYVMGGGRQQGSLEALGGPVATSVNYTDHLPVLGLLRVPQTEACVRAARFDLDRDLARDNDMCIAKLKRTYKKWKLPSDPEEALDFVTTATVQAVRKYQGWRRLSRWRDGWSPTMIGLQTALRMAIRVRRHLRGEHKYTTWTQEEYSTKRKKLCYHWRRELRRLIRTTTLDGIILMNALLTREEYGYALLRRKNYDWARRSIDAIIHGLGKRMHGRARKDKRQQISKAVAQREQAREAGRTGKVLRSIMGHHGKQRERYLLEQVRVDEGVMADARNIHEITSAHFEKWFGVPSGVDEYFGARNGYDEYVRHWTNTGIPGHLVEGVWQAIQPKVAEEPSLADIPTLEEFRSAMRYMKRDSAPGISGLSYNMMRTWTQEIVEVVYRGIRARWERGEVTDSWRWKWLAPIPKVADPHLDDLRPLGLLEPLRKVWMSIFVRRIWKFWGKAGVINNGQHGSVPGRSTATAICELVDALETAKECRSTVYVSSWDIRRAFDSVSKPLMQWALKRLGIPEDLIRMFSATEEGGGTIVRTPYAIHEMKNGKPKEGLGFQQRRGIPQGDVASPMIWVAVFDIVLDALELAERGTFYTKDRGGSTKLVKDVAYADDLFSLQGTAQGIQNKADMMSAACLILGFELAMKKFRAFVLQWGNEYCVEAPTIQVHYGGWESMEIPLQRTGTFKHLGVVWSPDLGNEDHFRVIMEDVEGTCAYIMARQATMESKWMAIRVSLYARVAYAAKFMAWTLEQYDTITRKISETLRKITKNTRGFPEALLYMDVEDGGLGLENWTDRIQMEKMKLFQRLLQSPGRHSASSCMSRVFEAADIPLFPRVRSVTSAKRNCARTWWATSVAEWIHRMDGRVEATGQTENDAHEPLATIETEEGVLPHDQLIQMIQRGVLTRGENMMEHEGAHDQNGIAAASDAALRPRAGLFWMTEEMRNDGMVIEIVASSEMTSHLLSWRSEGPVVEGARLKLGPGAGSQALGAGVRNDGTWSMICGSGDWANDYGFLVETSPDKHLQSGGNECEVISIKQRYLQTVWTALEDEVTCPRWSNATIYTDGSLTTTGTFLERAHDGGSVTAAASVVKDNGDGTYEALRIRDGIRMTAAYDAELLGLAAASWVSTTSEVYCDCESAIKAVENFHNGGKSDKKQSATLAAMKTGNRIKKVRAHAERRGGGRIRLRNAAIAWQMQ